jgi:hypothetical protein
MSTNIHEYRETTWYSDKPTHRWGWSVLTSDEGRDLALLKSKSVSNKLVNAVLVTLAKEGIKITHASGYPGEIEALFVMVQVGGDQDDKDWFHEVLTSMAPERTELWEFLMDLAKNTEIRKIVNA